MKKVFLFFILLLTLTGCSSSKKDVSSDEANKILEGKTKVPYTWMKSKEEVESLFDKVGLVPTFVVRDLDEKAKVNEVNLKSGMCDSVETDGGATYIDSEKVGSEKSGYYADKGSELVVGYTDHDFNGKQDTEKTTSASTEKSSTEESKSKPTEKMDSNEAFKDYLNKTLKVLEVNGVYLEDGNYTTQITLEDDYSMKSAINQVAQAVRLLNKTDLSKFSNVGISVKAKMTSGDLGYVVKSDWNPQFINSPKALTTRNKNVAEFAGSWWQLEN